LEKVEVPTKWFQEAFAALRADKGIPKEQEIVDDGIFSKDPEEAKPAEVAKPKVEEKVEEKPKAKETKKATPPAPPSGEEDDEMIF
jgi:hypothetical protein